MVLSSVEVVVGSVRVAKDDKSANYAEFYYTGGVINISVDGPQYSELVKLTGNTLIADFDCRPVQVVRFGRPMSLFDAHRLLKFRLKGANSLDHLK